MNKDRQKKKKKKKRFHSVFLSHIGVLACEAGHEKKDREVVEEAASFGRVGIDSPVGQEAGLRQREVWR